MRNQVLGISYRFIDSSGHRSIGRSDHQINKDRDIDSLIHRFIHSLVCGRNPGFSEDDRIAPAVAAVEFQPDRSAEALRHPKAAANLRGAGF
jgi:hypothetical protein